MHGLGRRLVVVVPSLHANRLQWIFVYVFKGKVSDFNNYCCKIEITCEKVIYFLFSEFAPLIDLPFYAAVQLWHDFKLQALGSTMQAVGSSRDGGIERGRHNFLLVVFCVFSLLFNWSHCVSVARFTSVECRRRSGWKTQNRHSYFQFHDCRTWIIVFSLVLCEVAHRSLRTVPLRLHSIH